MKMSNSEKKTQDVSFLVLLMIFLDLTAKAKEAKEKIDKWDYINLKRLFTAKEIVNKVKR